MLSEDDLDDLKNRVADAIKDRYASGVIKSVTLQTVEVSEDEAEIRFVFTIETDADPETIGEGFFGLTDKVRQVLGDNLHGYFPILQPEFHRGIAA